MQDVQLVTLLKAAKTILIVSAFEPEQQYLLSFAREKADSRLKFLCVGIGGISAAAAISTQLAVSRKPDIVVFCATAGAYNADFPLESACFSVRAGFTEAALVLGKGYLPPHNKTVEMLDSRVKLESKSHIPVLDTLCPPSITTAADLAGEYAHFASLENLEFFAVAKICTLLEIPWVGCFGISNHVGPNSHSEWKANHLNASRNAGKLLAGLL